MPKINTNSKLSSIGLIILFAISLVMAGGGKPKEVMVNASLRLLSTNEVMEILQKFPEMVPDNFKDEIFNKGDENVIKGLFNLIEIEGIDLLKRFFPTVRLIKANRFTKPPLPYLMAISDDKRYENVPSLFNRLLLDNNLEVNNKNIVELAKAFVLIALMENPPIDLTKIYKGTELPKISQITFLEGKRIKEYDDYWATTMDAEIKVRIGDGEIQTWKFSQARNTPRKGEWVKIGQLGVARVFINNKPVRSYQIKRATKETQKGVN